LKANRPALRMPDTWPGRAPVLRGAGNLFAGADYSVVVSRGWR